MNRENTVSSGVVKDNNEEGSLTVLAIDDEPEFLEFVMEALEENDIEVVCADSVDSAIRCLQAHSEISVVITDLAMPQKDGCLFLKYKQENLRFADIPCLVCSGHSSKDWLGRVLSLGAVDYIVKPVSIGTLVARVRRAVERTTITVLVTVPDPLVIDIFHRTLSRAGYRVFRAASGKEATTIVEQQRVSVLVTALSLTDMTGLDLLVEIKGNYPGIPVMFIADKDSKITQQDLIAAGADGTITLPFCNTDIIKQIRTLAQSRPVNLTARTQIVRNIAKLDA